MNWHNVALLWLSILTFVTLVMVFCNPFMENRKLTLWTLVPGVPVLILATLLVGGVI